MIFAFFVVESYRFRARRIIALLMPVAHLDWQFPAGPLPATQARGSKLQSRLEIVNPSELRAQVLRIIQAAFDTSKGRFVVDVHREWAPIGADRFYNLVNSRFFDDVRFFRVVAGQLAQFGMHGDPKVQDAWRDAVVEDDPVKHGNTRRSVSFASRGPNTRTTQLFINLRDNSAYDRLGFAPFAEIVTGMDVVDSLYSRYEERPDQELIDTEGNAYLAREFPNLDYIKKAAIIPN